MPPTLLIFIVGPGGSRPLEGGWQARLRTLCPSGLCSSPSNTWARDPEARGCGRTVWALRNGRALVPRGPTGRVPRDPYANKQGLVSREKHDICRAGQRRLNFPERCAARKTGREGLQVSIDSPKRVYALHLPTCPLLVARRTGEASPALRSCLAELVMPR